jgi:hypothetical protein
MAQFRAIIPGIIMKYIGLGDVDHLAFTVTPAQTGSVNFER